MNTELREMNFELREMNSELHEVNFGLREINLICEVLDSQGHRSFVSIVATIYLQIILRLLF